MTIWKAPEVSSAFGGLDDAAAGDGEPVSAHVVREMLRNGNRLRNKGDLMFRWISNANAGAGGSDATGGGLLYGGASWSLMLPVPEISVPKKAGLTKMRVRFRLNITNTYYCQIFVGTSRRPTPEGRPASEFLECAGTGSLTNYDLSDVPLRVESGERLSFYIRSLLRPATDALMVTATFGGTNTGTVDNANAYTVTDNGVTWNRTGNTPANGGHYITFYTDNTLSQIRHGPCTITGMGGQTGASTDTLLFWPPLGPSQFINGCYYEIRKLPAVQIASVACYSQDA